MASIGMRVRADEGDALGLQTTREHRVFRQEAKAG